MRYINIYTLLTYLLTYF